MMKLRIRKGHRLIMLMALKASDIHTPLMLLRCARSPLGCSAGLHCAVVFGEKQGASWSRT